MDFEDEAFESYGAMLAQDDGLLQPDGPMSGEWESTEERRPSNGECFYRLLGVSEYASADEISRAYRRLSKQWHPDRCKDKDAREIFHLLTTARDFLLDESKRRKYDMAQDDSTVSK